MSCIPMTVGPICYTCRTHYCDGLGKGSDLYNSLCTELRPEHVRTAELLVGRHMLRQGYRPTNWTDLQKITTIMAATKQSISSAIM